MSKQSFNPYLPSYEYVPDGEPYVFGDRLYVYGSHDKFNGKVFCENDYVCWSAPINDLGNWRYEGVIYSRHQDPLIPFDFDYFYAPDMVKGKDGRYYLYYGLEMSGYFGVAVSDTPAGKYSFIGHVKNSDSTLGGFYAGDIYHFDPAIFIDDDGKIYLYSGFSAEAKENAPWFDKMCRGRLHDGAYVVELADDMVTVISKPKLVAPGVLYADGTGFENHGFHEASSIRKINGKYYFVYSSNQSRELCYAISDYPDRDFKYGGTIVDICDIGMNGHTVDKPGCRFGNTHGGIATINGEYYIFYHRHSHKGSYNRQGCAEKIKIEKDGSIKQVEITSCGLNGKPLVGKGYYPSYISCLLYSEKERKCHAYLTQDGVDREEGDNQYIKDIDDGTVIGYKYFDLSKTSSISLEIASNAEGFVSIYADEAKTKLLSKIEIKNNQTKQFASGKLNPSSNNSPLFICFTGDGEFNLYGFKFE